MIFELTENEQITDYDHLRRIFNVYRAHSFRTALDDLGAGFSGLVLLAEFHPDIVKIDMSLIRDLHCNSRRHAVVEGIMRICRRLSTSVIAEGVETMSELVALRELGITLFQGYLFARPGFESLPEVDL